jgi:hypothetical protein
MGLPYDAGNAAAKKNKKSGEKYPDIKESP